MRSYTNLKTDTTIVSGISAAATTITLAHHWWNYPTSNFTVVLSDQDATPNQEVVLIASRSGAVLTVASRGWDGTTAKAFDAGDAIECQVVAADFRSTNTNYITSTTLTAAATSISVSNIPAGYEAIKIVFSLQSDRAANALDGTIVQVGNGTVDTGSNYSYYTHERDISTSSSTNIEDHGADTSWRVSRFTTPAALQTSLFGTGELIIYGYADAAGPTASWVATVAGTDPRRSEGGGAWHDTTNAIDIVTFKPHTGTNFVAGSSVTVYGVNAAVKLDGFSGASVTRSGDTIGTSSSEAIVFSSAASYDTDSYHSTTTNNTRLTAPADGKYLATASATWDSNATGVRIFWIKQDGTTNIGGDQLTTMADTAQNASAVIDMTAGQYVEAFAHQTSGGDRTIAATLTLSRLHSSGAVKLDDLTDVDTTTSLPAISEVLEWDGSNWTPGQRTGSYSLRELVEADAPISWLRLDERSGSTAADASGNSNTGTYVSSPTLGGVGVVGGSVDLDGTADYLTWDTIAGDLATLTEYTLEGWFNSDVYTEGASSFGRVLFAVNTSSYGNRWHVRVNENAAGTATPGQLTVEDAVATNRVDAPFETFTIDEWHHIAVTYSNGLLTVYQNGVMAVSVYHASNMAIASGDLISIGQEWDSGPTASDFFDGQVDEVAAYDFALSPAQIMAHFQAGSGQLVPAVRTSFSGARVYNNGDVTIGTGGTIVTWALEQYDTDSYHSTTSNTSRFTIPADGYYAIGASGIMESGSVADYLMELLVDGTDILAADAMTTDAQQGQGGVTTTAYLTAGQYVELKMYAASGAKDLIGWTTYDGYTNFWIYRLHSSGAVKLDDLTDVDTTTTAPATGDLLQFDGTDWVPATPVPEWMLYLGGRLSDETAHTDDIFFDGASSPTTLTVSGTATWTEARGRRTVTFDDQTSEDFVCSLWSFTSASSPMTIETRCRVDGPEAAIRIANLTIANGTAAGSDMVRAGFYLDASNNRRHTLAEGTFTAHSTAAGDELMHDTAGGSWAYLQLIWTAANTFRSRWSIDGVTWYDPHGTISQTMTPTHYGLAVSTYAGTSPSFAAFDYIRVYDTDESA